MGFGLCMEADKLVRGSGSRGEVDALFCGLCGAECLVCVHEELGTEEGAERNGWWLRPVEKWRLQSAMLRPSKSKMFSVGFSGKERL